MQIKFGVPRKTRRRGKLKSCRFKAQSIHQPADKTRALAVVPERLHRNFVHQAEITAARRNLYFGKRIDKFVISLGCQVLEKRSVLRRRAHRLHNLIPILPQLQKLPW